MRAGTALSSHADMVRGGVAAVVLGDSVAFAVLRATAGEQPGGVAVQILYLLPMALTVALALMCMKVSQGQERRFWAMLSLAASVILVSETVFSVTLLQTGAPGNWLLASVVLTLGAAGLFIPAMILTTRVYGVPWTLRTRYLAEVMLFGLLLFLVVLFTVVAPWYTSLGLPLIEAVLASIYSTVGLLILTGLLLNTSSLRLDRWRSWERIVAVGVGLYSLATVVSPAWHGSAAGVLPQVWAHLVEILWVVGFATVAIGAAHRLVTSRGTSVTRAFYPYSGVEQVWATRVTIAISLAAVPVLVVGAGMAQSVTASHVLVTTATLMSVMLSARFGVQSIEYGLLTSESTTDSLTGLGNHRSLYDSLAAGIDRAGHISDTLAVVSMDVDGFRKVNVERGNTGGDEFLRILGERLADLVEPPFRLCRRASDEFVAILPGAALPEAIATGERLRSEVLASSIEYGVPMTASVGVAAFPQHSVDAADLLRMADTAQFWAKCRGRDRVLVYDPSLSSPLEGSNGLTCDATTGDLATLRSLALAVDVRESATRNHSRNVARLVVLLGREMGLAEEHLTLLEQAAILHDVGKIGVSDRVLGKPTSLTPIETEHVREHPLLGERLLASAGMREVLPWVRGHHERWDGKGYPDGLAGQDIPLEARILAVCDAYDVITSDRPYRARLSHQAALQEIDLSMGSQFDPMVAEVFIRMMSADQHHRPGVGDVAGFRDGFAEPSGSVQPS